MRTSYPSVILFLMSAAASTPASLRHFLQALGYHSIPLHRYATGHCTLALRVNQVPAYFLLDLSLVSVG